MSPRQKVLVMLLTSLQVSLAVAAWTDLARRPSALVRGRKRTWAAVIAVNLVGPVLYFTRGRQEEDPA